MKNYLKHHTNKLLSKDLESYTIAKSDQRYFMNTYANLEHGLKVMIEGLEEYCFGHWDTLDTKVGDDGYTGRYVKQIAEALIGLLSSSGRFDGGTLDSAIRDIANKYNVKLDT